MRAQIFLIAIALAAFAGRASAQSQGLQIIGFSDSLRLRVDGRAVSLEAGSAGYRIPAGARATILSGEASILAEGSILTVNAGDSFMYVASDETGQILVQAGEVGIAPSSGEAYSVAAGEFAPLTGAVSAAPPLPREPVAEPVPEPVRKPEPKPVARPARKPAPKAPPGEEFDPLEALASGISKLSKFKRPKLDLVIEMRPFYELSQSYDSNIYLVPEDQADGSKVGGGVLGSWITGHRVGTKFNLPLSKRTKLSLLYAANFIVYATQPDANNAINQNLRVDFAHKGRRGTSWKVWEHFINTEDPAFSELVARERRFQNTVGFEFDYARSRRLFLRPKAQHTVHKYVSKTLAASLNRFESDFGFDLGLRVQPKTRVFTSYGRQIIHYSAGRVIHSKTHRAGIGAEGKLAPRLKGTVRADAAFRRYDVPVTVGGRSFNTVTTAINLIYTPGRRFEMRFGASRAVTETTFALNRYYVANRLAFGATHKFRKLSLSLDASFQTDRYPESTTVAGISRNRRDDIYRGSLRADYKVRPWLQTGLSHTRAQRHSIFYDQFNYVNDTTNLTLRMSF
jgi:hypothetical protein